MKQTVLGRFKYLLFLPVLLAFSIVDALAANPFEITGNMGLAPIHTPSAVVADYTQRYISILDIDKPSVRNVLIRRFNDQGLGMLDVISSLGYDSPVDQPEYSHYEEDWIHETFHSSLSIADPGAGNSVNVKLQTGDVDSSGKYYPRLWDEVLFPNQVTGKIYAIDITDPTQPVLTIYPHQVTDNIGPIAAGQELSIYSDSFPEMSTAPLGRLSKVSKITYNVKIMREKMKVSGSEMTNRKWFTVMSDGKDIGGFYLKGQMDTEFRLRLFQDGAYLFDRPTTTPTLVNANIGTTMVGLVPEMRTKGQNGTYNTGFFSIPLFYQMANAQKKLFAGSDFLCFLGVDLENEWEQLFTDFMDENPMVFSKQGMQPVKDLEIDFQSIKVAGQRYHMKSMNIFSHPKIYNIAGYGITGLGLVIPNKMEQDTRTRNNIPTIGSRYKAMDGYSRKLRIWATGGGNDDVNNTDEDAKSLHMLSEMGSEFMALNKFFLWERR